MTDLPHRLSASEILPQLKSGEISVSVYAEALLSHIEKRDPIIKAWSHLDPVQVRAEAQRLDAIPVSQRGFLFGLSVGGISRSIYESVFLTLGAQ